MNKNTNPNLPANAIRVTDLEPGMVITFPFRTLGGGADETFLVKDVVGHGFQRTIVCDGGRFSCNTAGTVRLVTDED